MRQENSKGTKKKRGFLRDTSQNQCQVVCQVPEMQDDIAGETSDWMFLHLHFQRVWVILLAGWK